MKHIVRFRREDTDEVLIAVSDVSKKEKTFTLHKENGQVLPTNVYDHKETGDTGMELAALFQRKDTGEEFFIILEHSGSYKNVKLMQTVSGENGTAINKIPIDVYTVG